MKIVVIGGTGLIGSNLVKHLNEQGHEAVAAAPNTGVNTITGEGLAEALKGASVVVDVSNSPSWDDAAVLKFFEFLKGLADISMVGDKVHLPPVLFQPMAADDVASEVAKVAVAPPVNGIVEIGGPEQFRVDELVRRRLASLKDPREVVADPNALYSGARLGEKTLVPSEGARLGKTRFETWLSQPAAQIPSASQPSGVAVKKEKEVRQKAS